MLHDRGRGSFRLKWFLIDEAPYPKIVGNRKKIKLRDSRRVPRPQDCSFGSTVKLFINIVFFGLGHVFSSQIEGMHQKKSGAPQS